MIRVTVTPDLFVQVHYQMEGVTVSCVEAKDLTVVLSEIERKIRMDLGLMKGKTFLSGTPQ